jgi:hypothetical protein
MYNKSSQSSTQKQHNSTVIHAPQAEKVLKIKSFFAVSRPLHPTALGQSMAFVGLLALERFAVDFLQKGRPPKALKSAGFRAFGFLTVFFSTDAAALCASNLHTNGLCPDDPSCFEPLSHTGEREDFSRGPVRSFWIRFFR